MNYEMKSLRTRGMIAILLMATVACGEKSAQKVSPQDPVPQTTLVVSSREFHGIYQGIYGLIKIDPCCWNREDKNALYIGGFSSGHLSWEYIPNFVQQGTMDTRLKLLPTGVNQYSGQLVFISKTGKKSFEIRLGPTSPQMVSNYYHANSSFQLEVFDANQNLIVRDFLIRRPYSLSLELAYQNQESEKNLSYLELRALPAPETCKKLTSPHETFYEFSNHNCVAMNLDILLSDKSKYDRHIQDALKSHNLQSFSLLYHKQRIPELSYESLFLILSEVITGNGSTGVFDEHRQLIYYPKGNTDLAKSLIQDGVLNRFLNLREQQRNGFGNKSSFYQHFLSSIFSVQDPALQHQIFELLRSNPETRLLLEGVELYKEFFKVRLNGFPLDQHYHGRSLEYFKIIQSYDHNRYEKWEQQLYIGKYANNQIFLQLQQEGLQMNEFLKQTIESRIEDLNKQLLIAPQYMEEAIKSEIKDCSLIFEVET